MNSTSVTRVWEPTVKEETVLLLKHLNLPESSERQLVSETIDILAQCGNPNENTHNEIGLVFGYVQSGKTMSFTTLTSLARDNGYKIIIILAGISLNLVAQSFSRLERDLQLDSRNDLKWLSFKNPDPDDLTTRSQIATVINEWRDPTFPNEEKKCLLFTVMKHGRVRLPDLTRLLKLFNLEGLPILIIDDEGDQYSLNTKAKSNAKSGKLSMSTTYEKILDLRQAIPHHTFLQYTATPQAPLFIDIMDNLSPNFIQLLTPGPEYTGGKTFFIDNKNLVEIINDIDPNIETDMPPESLIKAMQVFFLGVLVGWKNKDGGKRSMMIHPSQYTYSHTEYLRFVSNIKRSFIDILSLPDDNQDRVDLTEEFRLAYDDLNKTVEHLLPFEELISGHRLRHIEVTSIL